MSTPPRRPNAWLDWAIIIALLVGAVVAYKITHRHDGSAPTPPRPSGSIVFNVDGDVLSVVAGYTDRYGTERASTIEGPIEVVGLVVAAVAVTGLDVSCSITFNGVTHAPAQADPSGDPVTVQCVYAPGIQDVSTS